MSHCIPVSTTFVNCKPGIYVWLMKCRSVLLFKCLIECWCSCLNMFFSCIPHNLHIYSTVSTILCSPLHPVHPCISLWFWGTSNYWLDQQSSSSPAFYVICGPAVVTFGDLSFLSLFDLQSNQLWASVMDLAIRCHQLTGALTPDVHCYIVRLSDYVPSSLHP